MLGIYVHIPFCEKKCNYCAFSSFVKDEDEKEKYISHLIDEINNFHKIYKEDKYFKVDTIYFGGGTPSLLSKSQFLRLKNAIFSNFELKNYEWTVECNPNSIDEEKLKTYKDAGVNRISLGVQSLNDDTLKFLGRKHDKDMALEKIQLVKKYFDNVSCDLILGVTQKERKEILSYAQKFIDLDVKHISTYMLQIEPNTPFEKMAQKDDKLFPDDDFTIEIYQKLASFLEKKGYFRYEISNFALKGYESKHNLKYWSREEYAGFGLGAHSFLNGFRIANSSTFEGYYKNISSKEKLSQLDEINEIIMLGLRSKLGVNLQELQKRGYKIEKNQYFQEFKEKNIIFLKNDHFFLNPEYYQVNNYIISSLFKEN